MAPFPGQNDMKMTIFSNEHRWLPRSLGAPFTIRSNTVRRSKPIWKISGTFDGYRVRGIIECKVQCRTNSWDFHMTSKQLCKPSRFISKKNCRLPIYSYLCPSNSEPPRRFFWDVDRLHADNMWQLKESPTWHNSQVAKKIHQRGQKLPSPCGGARQTCR